MEKNNAKNKMSKAELRDLRWAEIWAEVEERQLKKKNHMNAARKKLLYKIIPWRTEKGWTYKQIAEKSKYSEEYVRRIMTEAVGHSVAKKITPKPPRYCLTCGTVLITKNKFCGEVCRHKSTAHLPRSHFNPKHKENMNMAMKYWYRTVFKKKKNWRAIVKARNNKYLERKRNGQVIPKIQSSRTVRKQRTANRTR